MGGTLKRWLGIGEAKSTPSPSVEVEKMAYEMDEQLWRRRVSLYYASIYFERPAAIEVHETPDGRLQVGFVWFLLGHPTSVHAPFPSRNKILAQQVAETLKRRHGATWVMLSYKTSTFDSQSPAQDAPDAKKKQPLDAT